MKEELEKLGFCEDEEYLHFVYEFENYEIWVLDEVVYFVNQDLRLSELFKYNHEKIKQLIKILS